MKKKPEAKMRRRHPGNVEDVKYDDDDVFANPFDDGRSDSDDKKGRRSDDEDYVQGPAVGVDNNWDNYYDYLVHPNTQSLDLDDDDYDYHLFGIDDEYARLPRPEVFNAYPPEVQRKILEWTDRDVKARRDDESRRQDTLMRERIARDKTRMAIPVALVVLGFLCAAITGVMTKNPVFVIAFLAIPLAIIISLIAKSGSRGSGS